MITTYLDRGKIITGFTISGRTMVLIRNKYNLVATYSCTRNEKICDGDYRKLYNRSKND